MWRREQKRTHDAWAADLGRADRELTLAEFQAAEAADCHALLEAIHAKLADIHAAIGCNPQVTGGYLEQVRNLLDRFVRHVTYPRQVPARPAEGRPEMRVIGGNASRPDEKGG